MCKFGYSEIWSHTGTATGLTPNYDGLKIKSKIYSGLKKLNNFTDVYCIAINFHMVLKPPLDATGVFFNVLLVKIMDSSEYNECLNSIFI